MAHKDSFQPASFDSVSSCLFINTAGQLFRLYCPFKVICQAHSPPYQIGDQLIVTTVGAAANQLVLYQIDGQHWPHFPFAVCT